MLSWEFRIAWGDDCFKNKKKAKVDSRIYGRLEAPGDSYRLGLFD